MEYLSFMKVSSPSLAYPTSHSALVTPDNTATAVPSVDGSFQTSSNEESTSSTDTSSLPSSSTKTALLSSRADSHTVTLSNHKHFKQEKPSLLPPTLSQQNQCGVRGRSSKFRGVSWYKPCFKWVAQISVDGRPHFLGYFDDEEKAAKQFDRHAVKLGRRLNFEPTYDSSMSALPSSTTFPTVKSSPSLPLSCTAQSLVTYDQPFRGAVKSPVVTPFIASHYASKPCIPSTPSGATSSMSSVYDPQLVTTNIDCHATRNTKKRVYKKEKKVLLDKGPSKYVGVRWHRANQKWTSYIRVGGKQMALGAFGCEEEAARKYDQFASRHGRALNFPESSEHAAHETLACGGSKVTVSKAARKKIFKASLTNRPSVSQAFVTDISNEANRGVDLLGKPMVEKPSCALPLVAMLKEDMIKPQELTSCANEQEDSCLDPFNELGPSFHSHHLVNISKACHYDAPVQRLYEGNVVLILLNRQWWPGIIANGAEYFETLNSTFPAQEIKFPMDRVPPNWPLQAREGKNDVLSSPIVRLLKPMPTIRDISQVRNVDYSSCLSVVDVPSSAQSLNLMELSHRVVASSQVRSMAMCDRAPRGSCQVLRDCFVEARHHLLSLASKHSRFSSLFHRNGHHGTQNPSLVEHRSHGSIDGSESSMSSGSSDFSSTSLKVSEKYCSTRDQSDSMESIPSLARKYTDFVNESYQSDISLQSSVGLKVSLEEGEMIQVFGSDDLKNPYNQEEKSSHEDFATFDSVRGSFVEGTSALDTLAQLADECRASENKVSKKQKV